jgi:hypothetical protein
MLSDAEQRHLDEEGWLALPGVMSPQLLDALRQRVEELFEQEGASSGAEFKLEPGTRRLANLVNKGSIFEGIILTPRVLGCVAYVLGPRFKLSSLNARSADPHNDSGQPLHADGGAITGDSGSSVCNSIWMLDDFTPENGATRLVPGSHRWGRAPAPDFYQPHPDELLVTGDAGTVVVMNAHIWHAGTANRTSAPRRALHVYYTRCDKPQQQYQKRLLDADVQARLTPEARAILALDDPFNDELSAPGSGVSGFLK